ncbi:hypothetical protein [Corallococcus sp. AB045]|uniref:hypothetical protein n=1 Tax=Corallococcus sp. AB045 TaxID=2316719 RepID=UPI0013153433|nr:hypothetical protein [Corallococcus sp. AB045]
MHSLSRLQIFKCNIQPAINVTNGYLEFGLHSKSPAHNGANFIHMDDVELIKL